jgi:L-alanine-DL-glutamate epimerase-like enolase superfamily enzyme
MDVSTGSRMKIRFSPFFLQLKHPFSISHGTRETTPAVLLEVESDGVTGYGEASLPPYLGDTIASVQEFLRQVKLEENIREAGLDGVLTRLRGIRPDSCPARAAVDIALHDWLGRREGFAWYQQWGLSRETIPPTSYTIGIQSPEGLAERVEEAGPYRILKVKIGRGRERESIEEIRKRTDKPIRVDVNEGWRDKEDALRIIEWLAERGVELVEQPLKREMHDEMAWLHERSPLPLVADEAVQGTADLSLAAGLYDGVNVKLMKCGGMEEAYRMIGAAKDLGLRVMLGCMTETSCGISAAAQLAPMADWVDLDGALLIGNDPFSGAQVHNGIVRPTEQPGIGIQKIA